MCGKGPAKIPVNMLIYAAALHGTLAPTGEMSVSSATSRLPYVGGNAPTYLTIAKTLVATQGAILLLQAYAICLFLMLFQPNHRQCRLACSALPPVPKWCVILGPGHSFSTFSSALLCQVPVIQSTFCTLHWFVISDSGRSTYVHSTVLCYRRVLIILSTFCSSVLYPVPGHSMLAALYGALLSPVPGRMLQCCS